MTKTPRFCRTLVMIVAATALLTGLPRVRSQAGAEPTHVIEVLADSDSRYKIAGERTPEITVKAGEHLLLRVTARRGKSWNRDGSIHGFSLLRAKDRSKVEGWDLLFKPGKQEFELTAPAEPGEYIVVCTVICSEDHEGMHMKFTVLP
jgi:heme/copper-type cytochrome/quinol oxidase subunit 2